MNKQREALKRLYTIIREPPMSPFAHMLADIIEEALAEPEQEPVAWAHQPSGMSTIYSIEPIPGPDSIPLYAAPPARKPLTDEDISAIVQSMSAYTWDAHMLARAIERAHGISE